MKFLSVALLHCISVASFCQPVTKTLDLSRIKQKKICHLMAKQYSKDNMLMIGSLKPTYHKGQKLDGYRKVESAYYVRESLKEVWNQYLITSPAEAWQGHMVSFGLLVSKSYGKIMYADEPLFSHIDTGQVFFINLKLMKGLYNLAEGLEIVNIDSINRSITFSYLQGGKSHGEQTLFFIPTRRGHTNIIHQTAFLSGSFMRDRYLYPYFHRIAINEFHRSMRKSMGRMNQTTSHHACL
jgi:hypothetical protein